MTDMIINKLPSKTWNWLNVNETKLPWDMEHTTVLPEENVVVREEPAHFSIQGACEKNARIELVQVYLGKGDIYSDTAIDLKGEKSSFKSDIGYIGEHTHVIDLNEVVNHFGRCTESEINVQGSLRDGAKKTFRGTIDFKTGASDSVGNEQETVLMLGEDVENKTVPVILCSEENVVGNHGATIGELDEDTLFYLASRGISREQAEDMMARAGIERLKSLIADEAFTAMIDEELGGDSI